jgi:hypothetical protein
MNFIEGGAVRGRTGGPGAEYVCIDPLLKATGTTIDELCLKAGFEWFASSASVSNWTGRT